MGNWEVRGILEEGVIYSDAFNKFSDFVAKSFFQTVDFGTWVGSAWVSLLESIGSFVVVVGQESDWGNFWVLLGDKKVGAHPLGLAVFIDVNWDFTVVVVVVLLVFLLLLFLSFFRGLLCWGVSGIE